MDTIDDTVEKTFGGDFPEKAAALQPEPPNSQGEPSDVDAIQEEGKKRRDLRRTSCLRPVPRRKGSRSRHRKGKCLVRRTLCGGLHPRINRFLPSTHFNHSPGSPDLNRGPARHMSTRAMPSPDRNSLSIHHSQASRMQHSRASHFLRRSQDSRMRHRASLFASRTPDSRHIRSQANPLTSSLGSRMCMRRRVSHFLRHSPGKPARSRI